jgi:putative SOS response-associated peptidase YedK
MCYQLRLTCGKEALETRFKATLGDGFQPAPDELNGPDNPLLPVITHEQPEKIQLFHWGLIPAWTNIMDTRKKTLNAAVETLEKQLSFKDSIARRCLVLVNGFYEYQWLDPKGELKQKYLLSLPKQRPFAIAGLWREGIAPNGEFLQTFTMLTTEAQGIMQTIGNGSHRMPLILSPAQEKEWLLSDIPALPYDNLRARMVGSDVRLGQLELF